MPEETIQWKSYDGDHTPSGRHRIRANVWLIDKDKKVRNLNFQKGFLNYFLDGLDHRSFQKQSDRSKPSGKFADLPQFRSL